MTKPRDKEIWETIPEWTYYEVSNLGRVRSYANNGGPRKDKPKILYLGKPNKHGYYRVTLCENLRKLKTGVHRLVLGAFVEACPDGMECRHLDGNSGNNTLENLKWGTHSENMQDRSKHETGNHPIGIKNHQSKLDDRKVKFIKEKLSEKWTCVKLAKMFKVCPQTIESINHGRTWRHI